MSSWKFEKDDDERHSGSAVCYESTKKHMEVNQADESEAESDSSSDGSIEMQSKTPCAISRMNTSENRKQSLPSGYIIQQAILQFNLGTNAPLRQIIAPICTKYYSVPKLRRPRRYKTQKPHKPGETEKQDEVLLAEHIVTPQAPIRNTTLIHLPNSDPLMEYFRKCDAIGKIIKPINPQLLSWKKGSYPSTSPPPSSPPSPPPAPRPTSPPKTKEICAKQQLQEAIASISGETNKLMAVQYILSHSDSDSDSDIQHVSLEEKHAEMEFFKSEGLHMSTNDVKAYNELLNLTGSVEGKMQLHEIWEKRRENLSRPIENASKEKHKEQLKSDSFVINNSVQHHHELEEDKMPVTK